MRVATTHFGKKIHLIDQGQYSEPPFFTACGRREAKVVFMKTPKAEEVCQVCARAMWVRIGRLRVNQRGTDTKQLKTFHDVPRQQDIKQGRG